MFIRCAAQQQQLIPRAFAVDELFDDLTRGLGPPADLPDRKGTEFKHVVSWLGN